MKKYLTGMIALVVALGSAAFTDDNHKINDEDVFVFGSPNGVDLQYEGRNVALPAGCPTESAEQLCGRTYSLADVELAPGSATIYQVKAGHENNWLEEFRKEEIQK